MIVLRDIDVIFNPGTPLATSALRSVTLEIPNGQFLTMIGSNGAGKSTLLNVIAGLVGHGGSVTIDGTDVTRWSVQRRARLISRVFQDPKLSACADLTILENFAVAHGRTAPRGFRFALDRAIRDQTARQLERLELGLENRLDDQVKLLSGGQRQAVSLLMAVTGAPRVLLLDEHTSALDPATGHFIMELTQRVVTDLSLTAIMVTHSMDQALQHGDRTIMLHRGQVVFDVDGAERGAMTVTDLLGLFKRHQGKELAEDTLLLD